MSQRDLNNAFKAKLNSRRMTYSSSLSSDNSEHYYQIKLKQKRSLGVELSPTDRNANLALLNRNGKVMQRSSRGKTKDDTLYRHLSKGTYYIRVSNQGFQTRYQLGLFAAPVDSRKRQRQLTQQILRLTNAARARFQLNPLKLNAKLSRSAQGHSRSMARRDFFSHTGANGSSSGDRVTAQGYRFTRVGENIAAGQVTAKDTFKAWMKSPGHRANILNPDFTEIGIGYEFLFKDRGDKNYQYYWTQNFGRPMS